jgi:CTD kinase subunit beta
VASKLHDTLKKPRDIILASYAVRFPQLVKKGVVDPTAVDPNMLEGERKRVLGIERLVLETVCFKFEVDVGLDLVVKIGKGLGCESQYRQESSQAASKDLCQHAWRIAVDWYAALPEPHAYTESSITCTTVFFTPCHRAGLTVHRVDTAPGICSAT